MTNTEKQRRAKDRYCSIDRELDEAIKAINWERRRRAERSLVNFIEEYAVGLLLDELPSVHMREAISEMEIALSQSRPYNIELPRGSGKTSIVECAVLWLMLTGRRKFATVIS